MLFALPLSDVSNGLVFWRRAIADHYFARRPQRAGAMLGKAKIAVVPDMTAIGSFFSRSLVRASVMFFGLQKERVALSRVLLKCPRLFQSLPRACLIPCELYFALACINRGLQRSRRMDRAQACAQAQTWFCILRSRLQCSVP